MALIETDYLSGDTYSDYSGTYKESTFGSETDLWGKDAWSPEEVTADDFQVVFDADIDGGILEVVSVTCEVFYQDIDEATAKDETQGRPVDPTPFTGAGLIPWTGAIEYVNEVDFKSGPRIEFDISSGDDYTLTWGNLPVSNVYNSDTGTTDFVLKVTTGAALPVLHRGTPRDTWVNDLATLLVINTVQYVHIKIGQYGVEVIGLVTEDVLSTSGDIMTGCVAVNAGEPRYGKVVVAGKEGLLRQTKDFGATWEDLDSGTSVDLNSISSRPVISGWQEGVVPRMLAVGVLGDVVTSYDGETWERTAGESGATMYAALIERTDARSLGYNSPVRLVAVGETLASKVSSLKRFGQNRGWGPLSRQG